MRERLQAEGNEEYQNAIATKTAVEKYFESKDQQYQQYKNKQSQLEV